MNLNDTQIVIIAENAVSSDDIRFKNLALSLCIDTLDAPTEMADKPSPSSFAKNAGSGAGNVTRT